MIEVNYLAIFIATVVQFVLGAVWYSFVFGKQWQEVMEVDCDKMSKEEMAKMEKEMLPFYGLQFIMTLVTTFMLWHYMFFWKAEASGFYVALMLWVGFIMPTQVSGVIWANTKKKYWCKQLAVMLSYSLVSIMLGAWILSVWM